MAPKAKEKPKPSAAAAPAIAIEDLFTALNRHIQRSEFDQAVKVADQGSIFLLYEFFYVYVGYIMIKTDFMLTLFFF